MDIFRVVAEIEYKEKNFYVLFNRSCQKYFIREYEDGKISYPTEEEFVELSNIFNKDLSYSQILKSLDMKKKYQFRPKVIAKTGKLITLLAALSLTAGCSTIPVVPHEVNEIQESLEMETWNNYRMQRTLKEGYEYDFIEEYEKEALYRLHIAYDFYSGEKTIYCRDFDEFGQYIDVVNPSYDDVMKTIQNNPNINEKYQEWLIAGLNNLLQALPNLNLTVLNYNLNRLKIIEDDKSEQIAAMEKQERRGIKVGRFDSETGEIVVTKTGDEVTDKETFYHEVFGHGLSEASFEHEINEKRLNSDGELVHVQKAKIIMSDKATVIHFVKNYPGSLGSLIGGGLEEGKAEYIGLIALGDEKTQMKFKSEYIQQVEQLRIMLDTVGMSLENFISQGGPIALYHVMQDNDVNEALSYIEANDVFVSALKEEEITLYDDMEAFKNNLAAFFGDYMDDKISRGEDKQAIIGRLKQIMKKGDLYQEPVINYDDFSTQLEEGTIHTDDLEKE